MRPGASVAAAGAASGAPINKAAGASPSSGVCRRRTDGACVCVRSCVPAAAVRGPPSRARARRREKDPRRRRPSRFASVLRVWAEREEKGEEAKATAQRRQGVGVRDTKRSAGKLGQRRKSRGFLFLGRASCGPAARWLRSWAVLLIGAASGSGAAFFPRDPGARDTPPPAALVWRQRGTRGAIARSRSQPEPPSPSTATSLPFYLEELYCIQGPRNNEFCRDERLVWYL